MTVVATQSAAANNVRSQATSADTTATNVTHYPGANVALAPPPPGAAPTVTAAEALKAYTGSGVFPGVAAHAAGPAEVRLVSFSDDTQGTMQADGSVHLTYQGRLAWAVIYHRVPYSGVALPPQASGAPSVPEDIVTIVDANTGQILEAFADTTS
jgi:hypothetical protein